MGSTSGMCTVCSEKIFFASSYSTLELSTPLRNYDSIRQFVTKYGIVDKTATGEHVCCKCFALAQTCDELLSMFWSNVNEFRANRKRMEPVEGKIQIEDRTKTAPRFGGPAPNSASGSDKKRGRPRKTTVPVEETVPKLVARPAPEVPSTSRTGGAHKMSLRQNAPRSKRFDDDMESNDDEDASGDVKPRRKRKSSIKPRKSVSNESSGLKCADCDFVAKSQLFLSRHYRRMHALTDGVACIDCCRSFSSAEECDSHFQDTHSASYLGRISCIDCRQVLNPDSFPGHVESFHNSRLRRSRAEKRESGLYYFFCKFCTYLAPDVQGLKMHVPNFHPGHKTFCCLDCDEEFYTCELLKSHEAKCHEKVARVGC